MDISRTVCSPSMAHLVLFVFAGWHSLLHGKKRSDAQLARKYCQDGGFKPLDTVYQTCIFCKHEFVDEDENNKKLPETNLKREAEYKQLKIKFDK